MSLNLLYPVLDDSIEEQAYRANCDLKRFRYKVIHKTYSANQREAQFFLHAAVASGRIEAVRFLYIAFCGRFREEV